MKQDVDLLREILVTVENQPAGEIICDGLEFEGHTYPEIADHVVQLKELGFLEAEIVADGQGLPTSFIIFRLTAHGHEFLQRTRNKTLWNRVKSEMVAKAIPLSVSFAFDFIKAHAGDLRNWAQDHTPAS